VFLPFRFFVSLRNDFTAEEEQMGLLVLLLLLLLLLSFAKPDYQTERISFGFFYVTLILLVAGYISFTGIRVTAQEPNPFIGIT